MSDSAEDLVDAYRRFHHLSSDDLPNFAEDRPGRGAAQNDQSIALSAEADGWKALLAGDMQFAKPEVAGLDEPMQTLRQVVAQNGPYKFIKLTHHTSDNGMDESLLEE